MDDIILGIIGVMLPVLAVAIFVMLSRLPDDFRVSRTAVFDATPAQIFPHVNNLKAWEAWSPWAKLDPNAKSTFEGPDAGTGAKMHWDGNAKVGAGSMEIIDSQPDSMVKLRLKFLKPMKATNFAKFDFKPEGDKTIVTWTMIGKNNLLAKAMSLVINCEKMIGPQFEKGLQNLRGVVGR